jgi:hypothetical protein
MKELIKKILRESEDEFSWVEKPDTEDKQILEESLRYLLKENGFNLIPTYISNRYLAIQDMYFSSSGDYIKFGADGQLYYLFPYELFSKEYLKNILNEHNAKFPTPKSFDKFRGDQKQYLYDKYKLIEKIILSVIE